jgi:hypothetical protein
MGLAMKQKQAVTRQVRSRYRQARRKEKSAIPDEFIRITGYKNRNYALRILNKPQAPQALLAVKGKAVKLKPPKKKPASRAGKKIYTDEVAASLRLIWAFFWYKCGKILAPLMRQQMGYIASWPAFGITADIKAKLLSISPLPSTVPLKKTRPLPPSKAKTSPNPAPSSNTASPSAPPTPLWSVNSPVLSKSTPADFSPTSLRAGHSGQYILTLTATDVASTRISLYPLLNKAYRRALAALKDIYAGIPFPLREFHRDNGRIIN